MKVKELMTSKVESCAPGDDLAAAAMVMWRCDCGVAPVVNDARELVGVITDRDICMATATRHRPPGELRVDEVMRREPRAVRPESDVKAALQTMAAERIRRVPVTDGKNRLQGILSISDLVLNAQTGGTNGGLSVNDVMNALRAICTPASQKMVVNRQPEHATVV